MSVLADGIFMLLFVYANDFYYIREIYKPINVCLLKMHSNPKCFYRIKFVA